MKMKDCTRKKRCKPDNPPKMTEETKKIHDHQKAHNEPKEENTWYWDKNVMSQITNEKGGLRDKRIRGEIAL